MRDKHSFTFYFCSIYGTVIIELYVCMNNVLPVMYVAFTCRQKKTQRKGPTHAANGRTPFGYI